MYRDYPTRKMMTDAVRSAIEEMRENGVAARTRRRRFRAVLWLGSTIAGEWFRQMGTTQIEVLTALDWVSYACLVMENESNHLITKSEWDILFFGVAALWDAPKHYPSRDAVASPWHGGVRFT